jgi:hypothetical protein
VLRAAAAARAALLSPWLAALLPPRPQGMLRPAAGAAACRRRRLRCHGGPPHAATAAAAITARLLAPCAARYPCARGTARTPTRCASAAAAMPAAHRRATSACSRPFCTHGNSRQSAVPTLIPTVDPQVEQEFQSWKKTYRMCAWGIVC